MTGIAIPARASASTERMRAAALRSVVPAAAFVVGLSYTIAGFNPWDEAWFLQVVARLRHGDVLYRDVAYGAGPLPVYVTEAITYVTGIDVFAVKLSVVLAFAASAALILAITERVGLSPWARIAATASLAYVSPALQASPYAPMAEAFLLAALLAILCRRPALAGVAAALAFACKQDVGIAALAASGITLLASSAMRKERMPLRFISASLLTGFFALVPVIASGGLPRYIDYGFTGKHDYVTAGHVSYVTTLDASWNLIRTARTEAQAELAFWNGVVILPVVALAAAAILIAAARAHRAPHALPVLVFAAAAATSIYPRSDVPHISYAAPGLVIAVAYACSAATATRRVRVVAATAAAIIIATAIGLSLAIPARAVHSDATNLSKTPHLRGSFAWRPAEQRLNANAAKIAEAAHRASSRFLILVPTAAVYYLITGLRNPTAFDYPLSSTFGRTGETRVIRSLARREIGAVCLGRDWLPGLAPIRLIRYVTTAMTRGTDIGPCTVYRLRAR